MRILQMHTANLSTAFSHCLRRDWGQCTEASPCAGQQAVLEAVLSSASKHTPFMMVFAACTYFSTSCAACNRTDHTLKLRSAQCAWHTTQPHDRVACLTQKLMRCVCTASDDSQGR